MSLPEFDLHEALKAHLGVVGLVNRYRTRGYLDKPDREALGVFLTYEGGYLVQEARKNPKVKLEEAKACV